MSTHPLNLLHRFHVLSPCRSKTSVPVPGLGATASLTPVVDTGVDPENALVTGAGSQTAASSTTTRLERQDVRGMAPRDAPGRTMLGSRLVSEWEVVMVVVVVVVVVLLLLLLVLLVVMVVRVSGGTNI